MNREQFEAYVKKYIKSKHRRKFSMGMKVFQKLNIKVAAKSDLPYVIEFFKNCVVVEGSPKMSGYERSQIRKARFHRVEMGLWVFWCSQPHRLPESKPLYII